MPQVATLAVEEGATGAQVQVPAVAFAVVAVVAVAAVAAADLRVGRAVLEKAENCLG